MSLQGLSKKTSYTILLVVGYANAVSVCPPNLHRLLAFRTLINRLPAGSCARVIATARRSRLSYPLDYRPNE